MEPLPEPVEPRLGINGRIVRLAVLRGLLAGVVLAAFSAANKQPLAWIASMASLGALVALVSLVELHFRARGLSPLQIAWRVFLIAGVVAPVFLIQFDYTEGLWESGLVGGVHAVEESLASTSRWKAAGILSLVLATVFGFACGLNSADPYLSCRETAILFASQGAILLATLILTAKAGGPGSLVCLVLGLNVFLGGGFVAAAMSADWLDPLIWPSDSSPHTQTSAEDASAQGSPPSEP